LIPLPPHSTPFPYTTLFRSCSRSRRTADSACRARQHQRVQRRVVHLPGKQFALHRHSIFDCWAKLERHCECRTGGGREIGTNPRDRKSTRLNSSHVSISYAV